MPVILEGLMASSQYDVRQSVTLFRYIALILLT